MGPFQRAPYRVLSIGVALIACATGLLMAREQTSATHVPLRVSSHRKPAAPAAIRTIQMRGSVDGYNAATGMLEVALGTVRYSMRVVQPLASAEECASEVLFTKGQQVLLTVAAYLSGPMTVLSAFSIGTTGNLRCARSLQLPDTSVARLQVSRSPDRNTHRPARRGTAATRAH
jgi:hypothetical protein